MTCLCLKEVGVEREAPSNLDWPLCQRSGLLQSSSGYQGPRWGLAEMQSHGRAIAPSPSFAVLCRAALTRLERGQKVHHARQFVPRDS
jgi:hypothetical protein